MRTQPVVIFEHEHEAAALFGATADEIFDYFDDLGYRLFSIAGEGPVTRESFAASTPINWLASPETSRA